MKIKITGFLLLFISVTFGQISKKSKMELIFNTNLSPGTTISLPLKGTVNATVFWGDGTTDFYSTPGDKIHTYAVDGIYTVKISGTVTHFGQFSLYQDKLVEVTNFGDIGLTSLAGAFSLASNLTNVPLLLPSGIIDLSGTFANATSFNGDISAWDVSNVTDMSDMFSFASSFNNDIGGWAVDSVTNMKAMFYAASSFNQNINNWNVGNVTTMRLMFDKAVNFNQDINHWDVSNVTDMFQMFYHAISFNQEIGNWNVGSVINMGNMFMNASAFNKDIAAWDVSNVTNMSGMFAEATSFNQEIGNWDVSNVTHMNAMFYQATSFNGNIGNWQVVNVVGMSSMFNSASSFNQDISNWYVGNVIYMSKMFNNASSFNQDLASWDVSKVIDMKNMFTLTSLSDSNYSNILTGWAQLTLQNDVVLDVDSKYYSGTPTIARQTIINNYNWIIHDNGVAATPLEVKVNNVIPKVYDLQQNYPNPFNPTTTISYQIPTTGFVSLKVFNILGQEVAKLVNEVKAPGIYKVEFDAGKLNSGNYFYQIESKNFSEVRKMMLTK